MEVSDGTSLIGDVILPDGKNVNADTEQEPVSDEFYFIVMTNVQNVKAFMTSLIAKVVCPVDCCVPDENNIESEEVLLSNKIYASRIMKAGIVDYPMLVNQLYLIA